MRRLILGIESSCDDTAAALVTEEGEVVASVIANQTELHNRYGGVFPALASRAHVEAISATIFTALSQGNIGRDEVVAIGVTRGPGLVGSLQVGINAASGLALAWDKPLIGVNHLRGHLRSADLEERRVEYPALVLLVSGGHTIISHMRNETDIEILGTTRDDSTGEAYDKVGRMLGLGYPGGPAIDKLARSGTPQIQFPRPMLNDGYEFSFSGLKSSVARHREKFPDFSSADVAASFVEACLDVLMTKCRLAITSLPVRSLVIVGGVAASPQLRERAADLCDSQKISLCLPPLQWSTDNAAMIALAAWDYYKLGVFPDVAAQARIPLSEF